jgi:hypothetical protein
MTGRASRLVLALLLAGQWLAAQDSTEMEIPPAPAPAQDVRNLPSPPESMIQLPPRQSPEAAEGPRRKLSKAEVARAVVGIVLLLVLAYIAGHPRLTRFEQRLKVNASVTTGLIFVALGMFAAQRSVGVLTDSILYAIAPIVPFCLGWYGFRDGFRFDHDLLSGHTSRDGVFFITLLPMLLCAGGAAAVLALSGPVQWGTPGLFRDIAVLGVACAMTSLLGARRFDGPDQMGKPIRKMEWFVQRQHLIGILGLMLIAVYERPEGASVAWQLPNSAWLIITVGVASALGVLAWSLFHNTPEGPPFIVVLLGTVALAAGMASYLRLAIIPVCFIVGFIVSELPGEWKDQIRAVLDRMQRPVMFVLLIIAGALWKPGDWHGLALLAIYLAARWIGNRGGMAWSARNKPADFTSEERRFFALSPTGVFAIAIVLSARDLYPDSHVSWLLTAVIGGAVLGELGLQTRLKLAAPKTESAA